jgi:hypothetical protein
VASSGKKWLVGCGVGCGAVILLSILLSVGGSLYLMRPFNRAIDVQKELVEQYGPREAFIPGPQGITPERMEAFLAVRRSVFPMCAEFREVAESFAAMEELDQGGQEPSKGEVFRAVGGLTGNIFGMVGNIGKFNELRNEALLGQGMGLGEYIWIYVLAYNSWKGHQPNQDIGGESNHGFSGSERRVILRLVRNHAEALAAAGLTERALLWEKEAGRMERTETGVPFKDGGLPAGVIRGFLPYEQELDSLYCEATSSFELNRMKKKGLSIRSD